MHHIGDTTAMVKETITESMREQANKAARELCGIADNIPYDATCEAEGGEINIRAACYRAAELLKYFQRPEARDLWARAVNGGRADKGEDEI